MRSLLAILTATTILASPAIAAAATILPLDRATILVSSPFDVKVKFDGVVAEADVSVTINGRLNMDQLERAAFIGTLSTESIATDSANTMSAYMSGHKTAVNALGVYADRTPDSLDDPKFETFAEALRRHPGRCPSSSSPPIPGRFWPSFAWPRSPPCCPR